MHVLCVQLTPRHLTGVEIGTDAPGVHKGVGKGRFRYAEQAPPLLLV